MLDQFQCEKKHASRDCHKGHYQSPLNCQIPRFIDPNWQRALFSPLGKKSAVELRWNDPSSRFKRKLGKIPPRERFKCSHNFKTKLNSTNIKQSMSSPITSSTATIRMALSSFDNELKQEIDAMEIELHKLERDNQWLRAQLMKRPKKGNY